MIGVLVLRLTGRSGSHSGSGLGQSVALVCGGSEVIRVLAQGSEHSTLDDRVEDPEHDGSRSDAAEDAEQDYRTGIYHDRSLSVVVSA